MHKGGGCTGIQPLKKYFPLGSFVLHENSHMTKIWRTTFLKEFFNKMSLKVGEHEYIYVAETKPEKKSV